MFKGLINTLNSHSKGSDGLKKELQQANGAKEQAGTKRVAELSKLNSQPNEEFIYANHKNNNINSNSKQNFGKRSRKKLSAIMGKLSKSSSLKHSENGLSNEQQLNATKHQSSAIQDGNNNNLNKQENNEEEEEDDEAFVDCHSGESAELKAKFVLPEEECDIPTFLHTRNCDQHLIEETRRLLKERYAKNPDNFYDNDYKRMLADDWTVSRFLLRRRLEPKRAAKLMEECGRFRKQYKMSEVQLWEFPIEFHKAGGLFSYAPDRVGNLTVYMRVKMYRRVPEISDVFKAFILCVLEQCDTANGGRGTAIIFDLTGCGLQNVDLGFLSWLLSSFRNYCPKGVSYILVYNLPWILSATCKLAMTWMSASNRRALRFAHGDEIDSFIARENLPDYCGGTCPINYRVIPEGSLPATEVCGRLDMTREQALKIKELFKEYLGEEDYEKVTPEAATAAADSQQSDNGSQAAPGGVKEFAKDSIQTFNELDGDQDQEQKGGNSISAELVSRASKFIA